MTNYLGVLLVVVLLGTVGLAVFDLAASNSQFKKCVHTCTFYGLETVALDRRNICLCSNSTTGIVERIAMVEE